MFLPDEPAVRPDHGPLFAPAAQLRGAGWQTTANSLSKILDDELLAEELVEWARVDFGMYFYEPDG
jgi:hypothetical protein